MFTLTIEDNNTQVADQFSFDHGSYIIGRLDECDIVLPSSSVSRKHARIFIENDRCYIEDLGSANGVIVDGQRVVQRRDLGTASQIRVGDFYMYLEFRSPDSHGRKTALNTLFITDSSDHHKLVRINDSFAGEEFSLSEVENTIGRTDENFILLSDPSISRKHGRIVRDGDFYTAVDLNSSNGTRVNGKPLQAPRVLKVGDIVEFGDIEFVFVDGATLVNPADYIRRQNSANILNTTAARVALAVVLLAGAAALVYVVVGPNQSANTNAEAQALGGLDQRAAGAMSAGQANMRRQDWSGAIAQFNEVLALAPDHVDAQELREQAYAEQEAAELLRQGEDLSAQGQHLEARDIFLEIPRNTVAHQRAQSTLTHVEKTLAYNLRNEASRVIKQKKPLKDDLLEAHQKLAGSLMFIPDDEESLKTIRRLEEVLEERKIEFEPFQEDEI